MSSPPPPDDDRRRARLRALGWFVLIGGGGLAVLPLLIYAAGTRTLGAYEGGGVSSFLRVLYGDFLHLRPGAWFLLLGPYALFLAVRWLLTPWRARPAAESDTDD